MKERTNVWLVLAAVGLALPIMAAERSLNGIPVWEREDKSITNMSISTNRLNRVFTGEGQDGDFIRVHPAPDRGVTLVPLSTSHDLATLTLPRPRLDLSQIPLGVNLDSAVRTDALRRLDAWLQEWPSLKQDNPDADDEKSEGDDNGYKEFFGTYSNEFAYANNKSLLDLMRRGDDSLAIAATRRPDDAKDASLYIGGRANHFAAMQFDLRGLIYSNDVVEGVYPANHVDQVLLELNLSGHAYRPEGDFNWAIRTNSLWAVVVTPCYSNQFLYAVQETTSETKRLWVTGGTLATTVEVRTEHGRRFEQVWDTRTLGQTPDVLLVAGRVEKEAPGYYRISATRPAEAVRVEGGGAPDQPWLSATNIVSPRLIYKAGANTAVMVTEKANPFVLVRENLRVEPIGQSHHPIHIWELPSSVVVLNARIAENGDQVEKARTVVTQLGQIMTNIPNAQALQDLFDVPPTQHEPIDLVHKTKESSEFWNIRKGDSDWKFHDPLWPTTATPNNWSLPIPRLQAFFAGRHSFISFAGHSSPDQKIYYLNTAQITNVTQFPPNVDSLMPGKTLSKVHDFLNIHLPENRIVEIALGSQGGTNKVRAGVMGMENGNLARQGRAVELHHVDGTATNSPDRVLVVSPPLKVVEDSYRILVTLPGSGEVLEVLITGSGENTLCSIKKLNGTQDGAFAAVAFQPAASGVISPNGIHLHPVEGFTGGLAQSMTNWPGTKVEIHVRAVDATNSITGETIHFFRTNTFSGQLHLPQVLDPEAPVKLDITKEVNALLKTMNRIPEALQILIALPDMPTNQVPYYLPPQSAMYLKVDTHLIINEGKEQTPALHVQRNRHGYGLHLYRADGVAVNTEWQSLSDRWGKNAISLHRTMHGHHRLHIVRDSAPALTATEPRESSSAIKPWNRTSNYVIEVRAPKRGYIRGENRGRVTDVNGIVSGVSGALDYTNESLDPDTQRIAGIHLGMHSNEFERLRSNDLARLTRLDFSGARRGISTNDTLAVEGVTPHTSSQPRTKSAFHDVKRNEGNLVFERDVVVERTRFPFENEYTEPSWIYAPRAWSLSPPVRFESWQSLLPFFYVNINVEAAIRIHTAPFSRRSPSGNIISTRVFFDDHPYVSLGEQSITVIGIGKHKPSDIGVEAHIIVGVDEYENINRNLREDE